MPTAAKTPVWRRAISRMAAEDSAVVPIPITWPTPAARAPARTSGNRSASLGSSRWAWVSTSRGGAGAGGSALSLIAHLAGFVPFEKPDQLQPIAGDAEAPRRQVGDQFRIELGDELRVEGGGQILDA